MTAEPVVVLKLRLQRYNQTLQHITSAAAGLRPGDLGFELLNQTRDELREAIEDLRRRLGPLADD